MTKVVAVTEAIKSLAEAESRKTQPERVLYLAIPFDAYRDFFLIQFIQDVIAEYQVKLLIFDTVKEEIVLWKE